MDGSLLHVSRLLLAVFLLSRRASEREWKKRNEWKRKRALCVRLQILCATKSNRPSGQEEKKAIEKPHSKSIALTKERDGDVEKPKLCLNKNSKMIEMKRHIDRNKIDISRKRFVVVIKSLNNINFSRMWLESAWHESRACGDAESGRNYWIFFQFSCRHILINIYRWLKKIHTIYQRQKRFVWWFPPRN